MVKERVLKGVFVVLFLMSISCDKDENIKSLKEAQEKFMVQNTGVKGVFEYGEGDCFPPIDEEALEYSNYNGTIYFVDANLEFEDLEILKKESVSTQVVEGAFEVEILAGTYVVMTNDAYFDASIRVEIEDNKVKEQNIKFFNCTSF